jgi:hypothetical protein
MLKRCPTRSICARRCWMGRRHRSNKPRRAVPSVPPRTRNLSAPTPRRYAAVQLAFGKTRVRKPRSLNRPHAAGAGVDQPTPKGEAASAGGWKRIASIARFARCIHLHRDHSRAARLSVTYANHAVGRAPSRARRRRAPCGRARAGANPARNPSSRTRIRASRKDERSQAQAPGRRWQEGARQAAARRDALLPVRSSALLRPAARPGAAWQIACAARVLTGTHRRPRRLDAAVDIHPRALVGRSVKVYWPLDGAFFAGKVVAYDSGTYEHKVRARPLDRHLPCRPTALPPAPAAQPLLPPAPPLRPPPCRCSTTTATARCCWRRLSACSCCASRASPSRALHPPATSWRWAASSCCAPTAWRRPRRRRRRRPAARAGPAAAASAPAPKRPRRVRARGGSGGGAGGCLPARLPACRSSAKGPPGAEAPRLPAPRRSEEAARARAAAL